MRLHADLGERAVSFADEAEWTASPISGVERRMLECHGDEAARTTGIVRYRPNSRLTGREPAPGEEILVLNGAFADEAGAYPRGTYIRNPPGSGPESGHASWSEGGCVLFVKLRQFHPNDRARVVVDTLAEEWFPGLSRGIAVLPLHGFGSERVSLVRYAPQTRFAAHDHPGGEEILVVDGAVEDEEGRYAAGSWLRNPHGSRHAPFSLEGCLLYVKIGHLPAVVA